MPVRQGDPGSVAMNRRVFVQWMAAAFVAPAAWLMRVPGPVAVVEAVRARWYPGPIREDAPGSGGAPGRWAG